MRNLSSQRLARFAVVGLFGLAACAGESATPTALTPSAPRFALGDETNNTPVVGKIKLCKDGNVSGEFTINRTSIGASTGTALTTATVDAGHCIVVAEDNGASGIASIVTIDETSLGFVSVSATCIEGAVTGYQEGDPLQVNSFHGCTVTYVNHVEPPEAVCDFVTFGRLVIEENGYKVVISGNAGGNQPGGGTLAEFHVDVNGTDNHVANVESYGAIGSGALFGYTNSRITTGTAKNGNTVELRVYDGGEPGPGSDLVYLKINGEEIFGASGTTIDIGNIQYHSTCRGPK